MHKQIIIARARVKAGGENAFIDSAKKLADMARTEPGNLCYSFYRSVTEPENFIFYEEYKDAVAVTAHASSEAFKSFTEAVRELLDGDLIVDKYLANSPQGVTLIWEKKRFSCCETFFCYLCGELDQSDFKFKRDEKDFNVFGGFGHGNDGCLQQQECSN